MEDAIVALNIPKQEGGTEKNINGMIPNIIQFLMS